MKFCIKGQGHMTKMAAMAINSDVDNDAYCVCTHVFLLCTHKNFRPLRTMYAVKISGTQSVLGFMRTQINIFKIATK